MATEDAGTPMLVVRNLEVVYDRVSRAIQGVSVNVPTGSIVGVVGLNGAGKTTLLSAIAGYLSNDHVEITDGSIEFKGEECRGAKPNQMSKRGMALVPERAKIFPRMSVAHNLTASRKARISSSALDEEAVLQLFPVLSERGKQTAGYLSGGERQMLATAMALLSAPDLLIIDEFSLGLAPAVVKELVSALRSVRDEHGTTILFVEQSAATALDLADYLYVMENGAIVYEGSGDKVSANEDFRAFYLGDGADQSIARSYRDVKQYTKKRRWFG